MNKISHVTLLVATLTALVTTTAWGDPLIRISGKKPVYELRGEDLQGVGAADIRIFYDVSGLKNPSVTQEQLISGAMIARYLDTPGVVRMLIIAPDSQGITGSGKMSQITFDSLGGTSGTIISLSASMVSAASRSDIPVRTSVEITPAEDKVPTSVNQSSDFAKKLTKDSITGQPKQELFGISGLSTATEDGIPPGGSEEATPRPEQPVAPPADVNISKVPTPVEPVVKSATDNSQSEAGVTAGNEARKSEEAKPPPTVAPKGPVFNGAMALFKEYKGPRTAKALAALFVEGSVPGVSQDPLIAIADGVSKVLLTVEQGYTTAPNFSVSGGKLISLTRTGPRYQLSILPDVRAVAVTVSLLTRDAVATIPLTVVPPLDMKLIPSGKLDEATFERLLKRNGVASGEIQGDGVRDYLNDYILTAHYLLLKNRE